MTKEGKSSAHTPAPWTFHSDADLKNRIEVGKAYWFNGSKGETILTAVHDSFSRVATDEAEANARLIAAAPELLAALIAFRDAKSPEEFTAAMIQNAEAAIAKASSPLK